MDDDLVAVSADQDNEFEKIPCGVRSKDQPAVGIFTKVIDHQRVLDGMEHVVLRHAVTMSRRMNLHTRILYYEIPIAGRVWLRASALLPVRLRACPALSG